MDRSSRQKIDEEAIDLNHTLDLMDLTFIEPSINRSKYTFFLSVHETFSRIDCMIRHKTSLRKFKKIEIIPSTFSDHNDMKLEINKRKARKIYKYVEIK